ncbi:hypothetical protein DCCM_0173 [Desulfocucumis palustris]|uniref:Uncharacterized protein n=1 Tax=Desulfocucumis palustris TaxID=1898651 RepID=A0A2L2X7M8_9FIRM|nr:hypothetical protein [Desulfocucumis palustris]GBF31982.1 hypothetical protein DCCM_0173 [Desulfocucumis palustris]
MARSADVAYYGCYAGKKKNNSGDMNRLIDAVNDNFATFREWNDVEVTRQPAGSLLERFKSNYSAFVNW